MRCKGSGQTNPAIDEELIEHGDIAWPCVVCPETVRYGKSPTGKWLAESHEEPAQSHRAGRRGRTKTMGGRNAIRR
jgi:hypothetical protein